jgi:hypothetical protein
MTRDLEPLRNQLAELERAAPVTEPPDLRRAETAPAWRWVLVAGILPLAVVGGLLLSQLIGRSDAGPSLTPSESGTETTPSESGTETAMEWTDGTPPVGDVAQIVWMGDRWLAVGSVSPSDYMGRPATWTSVDGLVWERGETVGPAPRPDPEPRSFAMRHVVVLPDSVIALGWMFRGCCDVGEPALWRSTDGVSWEFVETAGTAYGELRSAVVDAAVGPTGEIVVVSGTDVASDHQVLTSHDGIEWVEQPWEMERMGFIGLASSDELVMAIGYLGSEAAPLAVTSADGRSWSTVEFPERGDISDVAWDAGSGRFVVVGRAFDGRPMAWSTQDGTTWETTPLAPNGFAWAVSAADGLVVATGYVGEYPGGSLTAWTSSDGVTWSAQALHPGVSGGYVVATSDRTAVLYVDGLVVDDEERPITDVWVGSVAR